MRKIRFSRQMKQFFSVISAAFLLMGFTVVCLAESKFSSAIKEVSGEVTALSNESISITYYYDADKGSEYEIMLPIASDVKLSHIKSLGELGIGDTARVRYEEIAEETKEGTKINRQAKLISFSRKAEKKPQTDSIDSSNPPDSQEEAEE